MTTTALKISVSEKIGTVSALFLMPKEANSLLVLGHGAGAGMTHAFMEALAEDLAKEGIASLRYQFPFPIWKEEVEDPIRQRLFIPLFWLQSPRRKNLLLNYLCIWVENLLEVG